MRKVIEPRCKTLRKERAERRCAFLQRQLTLQCKLQQFANPWMWPNRADLERNVDMVRAAAPEPKP